MSVPDKQLERSAHEAFAFLFSDWNAKIVESRYERQNFGNGLVVIRAGNLLVRILRDRGQVSVEVGPENPSQWEWFDLERVIQILHGMTIGWPICDGTLTDLSRVLRENIPQLMSAFGVEQFQTTKMKLQTALEKALKPPVARG